MSTKPVPRGRTLKNDPVEIGEDLPKSQASKKERDRERERQRERAREKEKEMSSKYTKKTWEYIKAFEIERFIEWVGGSMRKWLAPAPGALVDEMSEKAVTDGIFDIIFAIDYSILTLNQTQTVKVSNFLSWAEKFDTGVEKPVPDLADLPDLPNIPNIKEVVDRLFDGPGRMYTNTPSVLYYCIYKYSQNIRERFNLTRPKQSPRSSDGARKDVHVNETHKESDTDDATCTGASCGGVFDWFTGRGGTRRRNKKRKSRKSNKRTNRIR